MEPRKNIAEIFTSYAFLEGGHFKRWITIVALKRRMETLLKSQDTPASETFWSLYWYKLWQEGADQHAKEHLNAYLQEACYWAAHKISKQFSPPHLSLADLFQTAIGQIDKVLKGFKPTVGQQLARYAQFTFGNLIRESLRCAGEIDICSDWALLRKISEKSLKAALVKGGRSVEEISVFVLCWKCFKIAYVPDPQKSSRKLEKPTPETLEAIAKLYNSRRLEERTPLPTITKNEQIIEWLLQSAKLARSYFYIPSTSLNTTGPNQEGEWQDAIADPKIQIDILDLLSEEEICREREKQQKDINSLLKSTMETMEPILQQLIAGYYRDRQSQKELAQAFGLSQPTVNRRLTKGRQILLLALAEWSQRQLNISINQDVLMHSSDLLEEWLQTYYS